MALGYAFENLKLEVVHQYHTVGFRGIPRVSLQGKLKVGDVDDRPACSGIELSILGLLKH